MEFPKELLESRKNNQLRTINEYLKLYDSLCNEMNPQEAFENLYYGWAQLATLVNELQPEYYKLFSSEAMPLIHSMILSRNKETTAGIIKDIIEEKLRAMKKDG